MLKHIGDCPVCQKPIFCAPNQIVRFHRECRTEGRKRFGKLTTLKHFVVHPNGMLVPQTHENAQ